MKLTERKLLEIEHDIRLLFFGSRAVTVNQLLCIVKAAQEMARAIGYDVDEYLGTVEYLDIKEN